MTRILLLGLALLLAACAGERRDLPVADIDCRTGLYRNAEGEVLALTPTTERGYRWRMLDGRTGALDVEGGASRRGWTEEADGFQAELGACDANEIRFGPSGNLHVYARVPLEVRDVTYEHDGLTFSGRLIWPAGVERAPLAVHVHGSERWSAVRSNAMPYLLAAEGVASFVYDKRGTGQSGGRYTQDFNVLAADAIAALDEARSLAGDRIERAGFIGASQGGWVAPLAASQTTADFVVALYGLAEGALAEDREQVRRDVADAGFDAQAQARAVELADAAGVIIASDFRSGFREFDALRQRYRDEPWYRAIRGEFTGQMLPHHEWALRVIGPMHDQGTSWEYDPMRTLAALNTPQFWMIAADDLEAPPQETIRRLRTLQAQGRPIDLAVYPNADHGMIVVEGAGDERRRLRHVENYFRQIGAWIRNRDLALASAAGAEISSFAPAAPAAEPASPAP